MPFGVPLAANLQAGETLPVSGATGNFGSAGVAVALVMGADCVIAPGRNDAMRAELVRRHGPRVRTVKSVRKYGRIVLMGGVGMLGGDDLALPYPWIMRNNTTVRGQWMLPREAWCA